MDDPVSLDNIFMGSVTVGERGQVVIPAAARESCGIVPGEKLLAFMHPSGSGVFFVKVEFFSRLAEQLQKFIQPIAQTEDEAKKEG